MANKLKLILLTKPEKLMSECDSLMHLLALGGIDYLHIRKETEDENYLTKIVNRLPKPYRDLMVLHGHKELAAHYKLAGLHHKSNSTYINDFNTGFQSKSFHSIQEIIDCKEPYQFGFLSPVFDSISKKGYKAKLNHKELENFLKSDKKPFPIIALGGINTSNIQICKQLGFDGVAVLGAIWNEIFLHKKISVLEEIKSKL